MGKTKEFQFRRKLAASTQTEYQYCKITVLYKQVFGYQVYYFFCHSAILYSTAKLDSGNGGVPQKPASGITYLTGYPLEL